MLNCLLSFFFSFYWIILIFSRYSRYFFFLSYLTLKSHYLCSKPKALLVRHFLSNFSNIISPLFLKPDLLEEVWAISPISVSFLLILCVFSTLHCFFCFVFSVWSSVFYFFISSLALTCFSLSLWPLLSISLFFQFWLHWLYNIRHFDIESQEFEGYGD